MITDLLLVAVGPGRTRVAQAKASGAIEPSRVLDNAPESALLEALTTAAGALDPESARVLLAGTGPAAERVAHALHAPDLPRLARLVPLGGQGLAIPMQTATQKPGDLSPERLLAALGAHDRSRGACLVVTAGPVVSADFVDAFGVLHPGVVAPGLALMLKALGDAGLPKIAPPGTPDAFHPLPGAPGGSTLSASMHLGCASAIRGLAHDVLHRFAEQHGTYPRVVATGDDAPMLLERDELIEAVVPDLVLIGMHAAWRIDQSGGIEASGEPNQGVDDDDDQ